MIISASRRTDIPAFYAEWFINRLKEGFLYVRNPFNAKQISEITLSPDLIECIVFWSKNPKPLVYRLSEIDRLGYRYYFQFTITAYDKTVEKHVPRKNEIIKVFQELSERIGRDKVIWRYDPIFLSNKFDEVYHLKWFEYLAEKLSSYTEKCIISFIDMYKKCQNNMKDIDLIELSSIKKVDLAKKLAIIARDYGLLIESCAEDIDLYQIGINHGKCIDDRLISKLVGTQFKIPKDKNQRDVCGCVESIDIGAYNTCLHACKYCYANYSQKTVEKNIKGHDKLSPLLTGQLTGKEKITKRIIKPLKRQQLDLFNNIAQIE
jgi:DNA repair photolyase